MDVVKKEKRTELEISLVSCVIQTPKHSCICFGGMSYGHALIRQNPPLICILQQIKDIFVQYFGTGFYKLVPFLHLG